jgi:hypothetical protein
MEKEAAVAVVLLLLAVAKAPRLGTRLRQQDLGLLLLLQSWMVESYDCPYWRKSRRMSVPFDTAAVPRVMDTAAVHVAAALEDDDEDTVGSQKQVVQAVQSDIEHAAAAA